MAKLSKAPPAAPAINMGSEGDAAVHANRAQKYGEHCESHINLGLAWTGLLQNHYRIKLPHPVPAFLVEIMFIANKLNRICTDPLEPDHYIDARVYTNLAEDSAKKEVHE